MADVARRSWGVTRRFRAPLDLSSAIGGIEPPAAPGGGTPSGARRAVVYDLFIPR
jgi:hypothetical protein